MHLDDVTSTVTFQMGQSGLPSELVDLVYLRISQINNCAYCLDMHTRDLLKKGQRIEKIALVQAWPEAGNRLRRA